MDLNKVYTWVENLIMNGIGGPGAKAVGLVLMGLGILAAVISFAVHKFNQRSQMPGWFTCLMIGIVGGIITSGFSVPITVLKSIGDGILSMFTTT